MLAWNIVYFYVDKAMLMYKGRKDSRFLLFIYFLILIGITAMTSSFFFHVHPLTLLPPRSPWGHFTIKLHLRLLYTGDSIKLLLQPKQPWATVQLWTGFLKHCMALSAITQSRKLNGHRAALCELAWWNVEDLWHNCPSTLVLCSG